MTHPLHYESHQTIFQGEWIMRWWQVATILLALVVPIILGAQATQSLTYREQWLGKIIFLAGIFGELFIVTIIACGRTKSSFQIRTNGIVRNGKLTPWKNIRRLAAYGSPKSLAVDLFFLKQFGAYCWLRTTDPLTPEMYEQLIEQIRQQVPQLPPEKLGGYQNEFGD